ncbi:MAG: glycosyltransferase, partial [Pseudomonadota bacterium]
MRVVVAIPTLNEAPHIEGVVRQIVDGTSEAVKTEVLVLDGGSTDGTQDKVEALAEELPNLKLVHNPGRSQAAALNMLLASEFQDVDVLIRADAHAEYPEGFVQSLIESLAAHSAQSVVIPMDAVATQGCFQRGLAWIADTKLGAGGSPHRGGAASGYVDHGHHAAFDMETFRRLGGYDVNFIANEDAEYDRRDKERAQGGDGESGKKRAGRGGRRGKAKQRQGDRPP